MGQQLNRAQTSLFFSSNTDLGVKEEIKNQFGAQVIRQHEKYLGYHLLLVETNNVLLMILKRNLLKSWRDGRKNCHQKVGRKF